MANEGISDIFLEIADLLDLEGVAFKPEAYRRAARTLQQLPEDVADRVRQGTVGSIPGIGEALSEKIREYVESGQVPYLEKLRKQWPPGLLQLMRLEGIGPKTTRRFFLEFQVQGPEDLDRVLREGKLQGVRGFGDRKIDLLRKAVARSLAPGAAAGEERRLPLPEAQSLADELVEALKESGAPLDRLVFAGSLRRRKESVGDLDLLATSTRPREVMERFVHLPQVEEVRLSGETKSTVILHGGFQIDLRVVPAEAFGAALQYFTGSKDHNVHLRSLANQKGLKINEYGLTKEGTLVPAPTEEEVYAAVGLPWIAPELRENSGEIEAAAEHRLPSLVATSDLGGELHIRVPGSVQAEDLLPWTEACRARGWRYAGFVARAEDLEAAGRSAKELRQGLPATRGGIRVLIGLEMGIETVGELSTLGAGVDYVVLRPPEKDGPLPSSIARDLSKEGAPGVVIGPLDAETAPSSGEFWRSLVRQQAGPLPVELAVSSDVVMLETARAREAAAAGVPLLLSGLPRMPEELPRLDLAVGVARRAWTPTGVVVNAHPEPRWRTGGRPRVSTSSTGSASTGARPTAQSGPRATAR